MRVLVIGSCGWVAATTIPELHGAGHEVIGFDLPATSPSPDVEAHLDSFVRGNVSDFDSVLLAMRRADAVLHLASASEPFAGRSPRVSFAVNVAGTYNVFETARRCRVQTVVLLSSAPVHLPPVAAGAPEPGDWLDDHLYDLTKRLQEEIARDFCERFGMRAIALRAGHVVDGEVEVDRHGQPLISVTYCRGGWVCRHDLARACLNALELRRDGFAAYEVIGSRGARTLYDIDRTEKDLGLTLQNDFTAYEA